MKILQSFSLSGKKALVTGGNQGLGKAFAAYWLGLPENAQMIQDASAEWNNPKKAKGPGAVDARASLQVDRFR